MPKAEIGNHIRRLRFEHGEMTQQQLAERAGCTRQAIIVLEHRRYMPSLSLAFQIAKVFGRTVDEVFHLENGEAKGEDTAPTNGTTGPAAWRRP